ncbi:mandelate racemase/muconate lactonizing enzyme family protein [Belliella sp. DSM 111904]|uniref:Mandelate racemase/muconate lactonizing enzyme family protein n=1 Tax=Belliella filtrata TaxID=2923435 RepID=A0ABS9UVE9_9BACT|nr:mandelate racemase/muconate lactonizing enzyme family protein [Belliella filtrata]MCH7408111.1 mandelate racemase/muconate lactonizing enzyme family protein [Belliella filtrata]
MMRNRIKDFKIFKAYANLPRSLSDATHTLDELSFIILRIYLENGIVGESYMLSFQYSPKAILGAIQDMGELLLGVPVDKTVAAFQRCDQANEYFGHEGVNRWSQAAFNIAMYDAWAKCQGIPVWKLLGGTNRKVKLYGSGGWISYSIEELLEEVNGYKSRGFQAVKIKVGKPDWKEDLERLRLVREAVGNDIDIMIDANQGMDLPDALLLAKKAKELNVYWFEEPINHQHYDGFKLLKEEVGMSLAMGEREYTSIALRELARREALDIWQPDLLRIGGVDQWISSAMLAKTYQIPVLPHFYKDYDVALLCCISNGAGAESFDWIDPLIDNPIKIEQGYASPHQGEGWGFSFKDSCLVEV